MWRLLVLLLPIVVNARFPSPPVFTSTQHYPPICYLPPDSGLCSTSSDSNVDLFTRYYFDATTQECYPFGVQGCGGNENRFKTKTECETFCRMDIK